MSEQMKAILELTSLAHGDEGSLKGFDGSLFAHPEKAGDADIDLVDQCQVLVAPGVLGFVHSDGIDLSQNPVFEAPGCRRARQRRRPFSRKPETLRRFLSATSVAPSGPGTACRL